MGNRLLLKESIYGCAGGYNKDILWEWIMKMKSGREGYKEVLLYLVHSFK